MSAPRKGKPRFGCEKTQLRLVQKYWNEESANVLCKEGGLEQNMSERIYNSMIPVMVDMISAIAGPEVGQQIANAPVGPKPIDESLPCTPKENLILALEHKIPRYLPVAGDTVTMSPDIVVERTSDNKSGKDWFGAQWTFEASIGATMVKPGDELIDSLEGWHNKIKFPDLEAIDWEESAQGMQQYYDPNRMSDWWVQIGPFERLTAFLGMENALIALMEDEDLIAEFFEAFTDYKIRLIKKLTTHYKVDMICFHDDWGNNLNGFIPDDIFERLIYPNMVKIVQATHDGGAYFNLHSDGKIERYMPLIVKMGIDMWNPAQSINDLAMIKREYGKHFVINGGMDELWTNDVHASEEKLRAFAREKTDLLGKDGGFYGNPGTFAMRNKGIMTDELKKYGRHFYE